MLLDPTKTPVQRNFGWQQTQYYRITVNFNDPGIASGVAFGAMPKGAFIMQVSTHVVTGFNAATTNTITIGTTQANANEIVASGAITAGTPGFSNQTTAAGLGLAATNAADVTLWVKYAQTGTAATAGQAVIILEYVMPNDL